MDVNTLLAPISAESPAGVNVREDAEATPLYYKIKDARSVAREAERRADIDPDTGGLAPEWRQVHGLAAEILATKSKDIEVAAWLLEAALRIDGFAGLRDGMAVLDGLVERYWPLLHSIDHTETAAKVAPLAGLNGLGNEGSLIQPIRLAPLTAPATGQAAALWHYMVLRKRGAATPEAILLQNAVSATSAPDFRVIYTQLTDAAAHFASLSQRLDELCGDESPPSSTIANTLIEAQDALRDISGLSIDILTGEPVLTVHASSAARPTSSSAPAPQPSAPISAPAAALLETREDALQELTRIAAFFRKHEPNSPTAYALQTLIRRARLPLRDLLAELLPDDAARRTYLTAAGIGPDGAVPPAPT